MANPMSDAEYLAITERDDWPVLVAFLSIVEQNVDEDNWSAVLGRHLFVAAGTGAVRITRALLFEKGADPNFVEDGHGLTPLHTACHSGHTEIVDMLASNGASLNVQNARGYTPLFTAVLVEQTATVNLLLKHGADLNVECPITLTEAPGTPLFQAILLRNATIAKLLLDHGADGNAPVHIENEDISNMLQLAVQIDGQEVVGLLLDRGSDWKAVNQGGMTILHIAIQNDSAESLAILRSLLRFPGVDLHLLTKRDNDGRTPWDAARASPAFFGLLREHCLREAFAFAQAESRCLHIVFQGARFTDNGEAVLPVGTLRMGELLEVLDIFVSQNPGCISFPGDNHALPLHTACAAKSPVGVVTYLSRVYPIAVRTLDHRGETPLHYACRANAPIATVQYLAGQYPESLRIRNNDGLLPLHVLCASNNPSLDVVMYLVQQFSGAMAAKTRDGLLPILVACTCDASLDVIFSLMRTTVCCRDFGIEIGFPGGERRAL